MNQLIRRCLCPVCREVTCIVWGDRIGIFPPPIPLLPPLFENPLQQLIGGFDIGMLFTPFFRQFSGDGGVEDGLAVALELGFGVAQGGDTCVEPGKEFLNPRNDAALFGEGGAWDLNISYNSLGNVWLCSASTFLTSSRR